MFTPSRKPLSVTRMASTGLVGGFVCPFKDLSQIEALQCCRDTEQALWVSLGPIPDPSQLFIRD